MQDLKAKAKSGARGDHDVKAQKSSDALSRSPVTGRDQKDGSKRTRRQNDDYKRRKTKRDNQED